MAKHGQQQQEPSANDQHSSCGGRQTVVELCEISECGIIFWSRQRFDIGAEVQVRIKRSALAQTGHWVACAGPQWVMLKGLVVACPAQRRPDGTSGFEVSLLMEEPLNHVQTASVIASTMSWFEPLLHGRRCLGLN